MKARISDVRSSGLVLILLCAFLHEVHSAKPIRKTANFIESMNPIVRYRFTSHLKNRLQQFQSVKANRPKENRNSASRNCFFSPVQCHLPVEVVGQQRPDNLYVVNKFRKRLASLPFLKSSTFDLED
ncbi:hypothetical protein L596_020304 [Steinernema carpocapsae]|uniref:Uncharacterized protein n=1 Tax=Steinernema carpocapsae TaxID=34508 RepID=A0A4U5MT72_STECR|nr:hypothetical protein L596_020304 [Steinernema carpocapsae]